MRVGYYVRTKTGVIAKCIKEECDRYVFDKIIVEDGYYIDYEYKDVTPRGSYILKSSPNIIDLIEVGDYVNGERVINIMKKHEYLEVSDEEITIDKDEIKSIVTKEAFESMEYKIDDKKVVGVTR